MKQNSEAKKKVPTVNDKILKDQIENICRQQTKLTPNNDFCP